jgi:CubicO group peptidase (beta-lactamase class C family)
MKFRAIYIILILLFTVSKSHPQPDIDSLTAYIENARIKFNVTGVSVGIIKDGKVLLLKGFGYRDAQEKTEVTGETIFGVASLTKAFTAASIAILVDQKKIKWEDKVIDHLPWFRLYDPYATNEMMVIDLLCHRSGLGTFDGDLLWYGTNYSREEVVKRIRFQKPDYSFREKFGYQNVMFIAAGELIEEVSGMSWDQFIVENIFEPLGMNNSSTTNSNYTRSDDISLPHINGEPVEFINYDNAGPAASLNISSEDMLKWFDMWLNKGMYNEKQIISRESIEYLTSPHTIVRGGREEIGGTHFRLYGAGWELWDYAGRKIIDHGGGLPGVHTQVSIIPEDKLGIVILTNELTGFVPSVYRKILDEFLTEKNIDYVEKNFPMWEEYRKSSEVYMTERENERITGTSPLLSLDSYTGKYNDVSYGDAEVTLSDTALSITFLPTAELFTSKMEHWQYNTFRIKFNDPFLPGGFITFDIDGNGKVTGFSIDLPNPDFHFEDMKFLKVP